MSAGAVRATRTAAPKNPLYDPDNPPGRAGRLASKRPNGKPFGRFPLRPLRIERDSMPSVRPARRQEISQLAAIERAADTLFPPGRIPPGETTYPLEALENVVRTGQVLVAESQAPETKLVGFSVAKAAGDAFHLELIAVHPDFGRRGIGTRLLTQVRAEALLRGAHGITLTTFSDIEWNAPYYARFGFRRLDEKDIDPRLQAILDAETRAGMTNRIAMLLSL